MASIKWGKPISGTGRTGKGFWAPPAPQVFPRQLRNNTWSQDQQEAPGPITFMLLNPERDKDNSF